MEQNQIIVVSEYQIYVTQEFEKEFKALTKKNKNLREAISRVIDKLGENPNLGKLLSHYLSGKWTIRVERVYRIIYEIDEKNKIATLMTIKHRKKAY